MLAALIILAYVIIGFGVGYGIEYIRTFDRDRSKFSGPTRDYDYRNRYRVRRKFDSVGDGITPLFCGVAWPVGFTGLIYHLMVVDWSREQRTLVRELRGTRADETTGLLQDTVDRQREKRRTELEAELKRLEAEGLQR